LNNNPPAAASPRKGLVQIFTGDGKGKTTAAAGTIIRAMGHGLKIYVAVFMKGDNPSGEWTFLSKQPGIKIERFGLDSLCTPANIKPAEKEQAERALNASRQAINSGKYDIVVLDEINVAIGWKLIELSDVISLVEEKPAAVELILTGRRAEPELVKRADLVTEMLKIKHPFDAGIAAREGIEY
jgi:cob(I)alamin adenosyltransferase